ncbi:MAG TPA: thylakoid-associated protein, partial [Cyanobacteria bacterium UBA11691]|nr:thylakoid-associated protein [Cyanobacteria bacterium UBA11691]
VTKEGYQTEGDRFGHLLLSKEAMDADVVINLPKIKAHQQLTMTLGVKNLFGCVPGKMKAWWHMQAGKSPQEFGAMLVETARTIAPNLTILDGIIAHEGNGPMRGIPRFLGILGASEDVFALDLNVLEILGVDPMEVPTHVAALAAGCYAQKQVEFPLCNPQELAIANWKLPDKIQPIDFGMPRVIRSTFKHLYIRLIKEPMSAYQRE